MILLLPSVTALLTLFGQCSAGIVRVSKPKPLSTIDIQNTELKYFSPDLLLPPVREMQHELASFPTMSITYPDPDSMAARRNLTDVELSLMKLQPPKMEAAKNYYAMNSKSKFKKYQEPQKKPFGVKMKQAHTTVEPRIMDGFYERSDKTMVIADESNNVYISARPVDGPAARMQTAKLRQEDLNTGEYLPDTDFFIINAKDLHEASTFEPPRIGLSSEQIRAQQRRDVEEVSQSDGGYNESGERMEFQMHGFNGPDSYKFGFDTGKGKNRQFRVEQRDKNGNVKGQYGYVDKSGKLTVIRYISTAEDGFKSEKMILQ